MLELTTSLQPGEKILREADAERVESTVNGVGRLWLTNQRLIFGMRLEGKAYEVFFPLAEVVSVEVGPVMVVRMAGEREEHFLVEQQPKWVEAMLAARAKAPDADMGNSAETLRVESPRKEEPPTIVRGAAPRAPQPAPAAVVTPAVKGRPRWMTIGLIVVLAFMALAGCGLIVLALTSGG